jgi:hypothetical protein
MIEEEIKSKSIQLQNKKFSSPGLTDAWASVHLSIGASEA